MILTSIKQKEETAKKILTEITKSLEEKHKVFNKNF